MLPTVGPEATGLGRPTIMDKALAERHGVPYVHLVVFAIDLDRMREVVEEEGGDTWPFGFEVFLTEVHMLGMLDPADEAHLELLEDVVASVLEGDRDALGAFLPFAIHDAVRRGSLPERLASSFVGWKKKPSKLHAAIDALWNSPEVEAADLAMACLELELTPPLAPPVKDALESMLATFETDATYEGEPPKDASSEDLGEPE